MTKITLNNPQYPQKLREINQPPAQLFANGDLNLLNEKCIAIVGPRRASFYGQQVAKQLVTNLVAAGYCIVSGLARGIDTIAHRTAITNQGKTIAVIGNGLDKIYPAKNRQLYQDIAQQGLLLTEHPDGTPPLPHHFPLRNRIISGLSYATIVIEAKFKSGSLITAEYAFNQNRDVFAIPGNIFRQTSQGVHQLIANNKAKLVTSVSEIINHLESTAQLTIPFGPKKRGHNPITKKLSQLNQDELKIIDIIETSPFTASEIAEKQSLPLNRITSILTNLELREFIRKLPGAKYQAL